MDHELLAAPPTLTQHSTQQLCTPLLPQQQVLSLSPSHHHQIKFASETAHKSPCLLALRFTEVLDLSWECRDGSVLKSTGCYYGGPGFGSRHPHGGSQPMITPVPGNSPLSLASAGAAHMWCTDLDTSQILIPMKDEGK